MNEVIQPSDAFPWLTLAFADYDKPVEYTAALQAQNVPYVYGAKADPLGEALGNITGLDCSGFVRDCLFRSLGDPGDFDIPDGSDAIHQWAIAAGLKQSEPADAGAADHIWRIAFLQPTVSHDGIGHVLLIRDGTTYESYGGHGPGTRVWGSSNFMSLMKVFVLALPPAG